MHPPLAENFLFLGDVIFTLLALLAYIAYSGPVAQLVERLLCTQEVTGSNPAGSTIPPLARGGNQPTLLLRRASACVKTPADMSAGAASTIVGVNKI